LDSNNVSRRLVLGTGLAALIAVPLRGFTMATTLEPQRKPKPPALADDLVKEFVGAGHGNLDRVKEMHAAEPGLLNATWDWGGGDFETAIGGAGHMGRADIATYLIEQGARYDIFVAAMLGQLDFVKAALTAHPNLLNSDGPHGIPLLTHAEKGGEGSKHVLEYLKTLG
jgi:hypothetical protein